MNEVAAAPHPRRLVFILFFHTCDIYLIIYGYYDYELVLVMLFFLYLTHMTNNTSDITHTHILFSSSIVVLF